MNYVAIAAAIVLSSIAAYFSVLGLAAIFAASAVAVIVMASALEATKVITAVWLHLNWNQLAGSLKTYLVLATLALMGITSMGIFGFLSKAHIDHQVQVETTVGAQMKLIDMKIANKQRDVDDLDKQINQIDGLNSNVVETAKRASDSRKAVTSVRGSKADRQALVKQKESLNEEMTVLQTDKIKLEGEVAKLEAEVGPLRYIADKFSEGGHADKSALETAVFWLIMVLVVCFDPLAIMLLLATNIRFNQPVAHAEPLGFVSKPVGLLATPQKLLAKLAPEPEPDPPKKEDKPKAEEPPKRVRRRVVKKVEWGITHQPNSNVVSIAPNTIKKRRGRPKNSYVRIPDKAITKF